LDGIIFGQRLNVFKNWWGRPSEPVVGRRIEAVGHFGRKPRLDRIWEVEKKKLIFKLKFWNEITKLGKNFRRVNK